jgi:hypothetical protein
MAKPAESRSLGLVLIAPIEAERGLLSPPELKKLRAEVVASAGKTLAGTGWTLLLDSNIERLLADRGISAIDAHEQAKSPLDLARLVQARYLVTLQLVGSKAEAHATATLLDVQLGNSEAVRELDGPTARLSKPLAQAAREVLLTMPLVAPVAVAAPAPKKADNAAPKVAVVVRSSGGPSATDLERKLWSAWGSAVRRGKSGDAQINVTVDLTGSVVDTGPMKPCTVSASAEVTRGGDVVGTQEVTKRVAHVDPATGFRLASERAAEELARRLLLSIQEATQP